MPICTVGRSEAAPTCEGALTDEAMPRWSYGAQCFRPPIEGSFLRILGSRDHLTWRVQAKSGITMELGVLDGTGDRGGIQTNPDDRSQITRWALVRQYDTQGSANPTSSSALPTPINVVVYRYDIENGPALLLTDTYDTYDTAPAVNPPTPGSATCLAKLAHS